MLEGNGELRGLRVLMVAAGSISSDNRIMAEATALQKAGCSVDLLGTESLPRGQRLYGYGEIAFVSYKHSKKKPRPFLTLVRALISACEFSFLERLLFFFLSTLRAGWSFLSIFGVYIAVAMAAVFFGYDYLKSKLVLTLTSSDWGLGLVGFIDGLLVSACLFFFAVIAVLLRKKIRRNLLDVAKDTFGFTSALSHLNYDLSVAARNRLSKYEYHAVHAHDIHALVPLASVLQDRAETLIYDAHEYAEAQDGVLEPRKMILKRALSRKALRRVDFGITVSPWLAEHYSSKYDKPFLFVANAPVYQSKRNVDLDIRVTLGLSGDELLVLHIGGINPRRGSVELARALAHLPPNLHFCFVSNSKAATFSEMSEIYQKERAKTGLGATVYRCPAVQPDQIISFVSSATASVVTRLPDRLFFNPQREYAFPNKLNESLHARLPLIMADCFANRWVENHLKVGRCANLRSPSEFSALILDVANSADEFVYTEAVVSEISEKFSRAAADAVVLEPYREIAGAPINYKIFEEEAR